MLAEEANGLPEGAVDCDPTHQRWANVDRELEVVADDGNVIGEGPIWDGDRNRLLWTDIGSGLVYQIDAGGEKSVISRGLTVAGIGLNGDGRLISRGRHGSAPVAGTGRLQDGSVGTRRRGAGIQ